jgi:hypothetical protein
MAGGKGKIFLEANEHENPTKQSMWDVMKEPLREVHSFKCLY